MSDLSAAHLLIVDDDERIRELLKRYLMKQGFMVTAARDAAQLSQQQLSKHLGVRLKTLKSWENDSSEPRSNKLSMIAGVLNVSLIWLLTGEGEGVLAPDDMPQPAPELAQVMSDIKDLKEILAGYAVKP